MLGVNTPVYFPEWQTVGPQSPQYFGYKKYSSSKASSGISSGRNIIQAKGSHVTFVSKEAFPAGGFQEGLGANRVSLASSELSWGCPV